MFCNNCGKRIPPNTKFCPYCGAKQILQLTNNSTLNSHQSHRNHKHHYGLMIILVVLVILIIGGFSGYKWYINSPISMNMEKQLPHNKWNIKMKNHTLKDLKFHKKFTKYKNKKEYDGLFIPINKNMIKCPHIIDGTDLIYFYNVKKVNYKLYKLSERHIVVKREHKTYFIDKNNKYITYQNKRVKMPHQWSRQLDREAHIKLIKRGPGYDILSSLW